jgi:hypothetical protein
LCVEAQSAGDYVGGHRGLLGDLGWVDWVHVVEMARQRDECEWGGGAVSDQEEERP